MTVDLYSRIGGKPPFGFEHPNPEERRSGAFLAARDEQSVPDLDAARRYLATRPEVDAGRIGTLGYCLGGGPSLVWATQSADLKACVILYALPILPPHYSPENKPRSRIDIAAAVRCPVQCHFGENDEVIPLDQVRSLDAALHKSGQPVELHTYAGAGHAFEDAGHPNHHAAAARQVFERSVAFFRQPLMTTERDEHLDGLSGCRSALRRCRRHRDALRGARRRAGRPVPAWSRRPSRDLRAQCPCRRRTSARSRSTSSATA